MAKMIFLSLDNYSRCFLQYYLWLTLSKDGWMKGLCLKTSANTAFKLLNDRTPMYV